MSTGSGGVREQFIQMLYLTVSIGKSGAWFQCPFFSNELGSQLLCFEYSMDVFNTS